MEHTEREPKQPQALQQFLLNKLVSLLNYHIFADAKHKFTADQQRALLSPLTQRLDLQKQKHHFVNAVSNANAPNTTYQVCDEVISMLMHRHKMLNPFQISDLLHFIQVDKNKPQLLWLIFDAYSLIRYNQLCENYLVFNDMFEFVNKYPEFKQVLLCDYQTNIDGNADDIRYLFNNLHNEYCASFGKPISMAPDIKIKDSIFIFVSYIIGMNMAVRKYIEPTPVQCPFIIDFWIIPNRTARFLAQHEIDNDIGNITQRLKQNQVTFVKQKCRADDISSFAEQITNCLFAKKIKHALDKDHVHICRLIFIVDRRYNKRDILYCIVPPSEYGQVITNASYDILNVEHWYCSSNYLLPHTSAYDTSVRDTHIGSATHLNGYMFNLSYLIYPKPNVIDNNAAEIEEKRHINDDTENIERNLINKDNITSDVQISTANVKIMFSTQGTIIRFVPHEIINLFTRYFSVDAQRKSDLVA
eukprot:774322_1